MEIRKFTQIGTFSLAIMVPIFVFCIVMMLYSGISDSTTGIIFGLVTLTFLLCILIFYKITIKVSESYVMFSLGIGLIKKKYLISDIKSCHPVRNSPLYGIGIRKIPGGWLFNVSGLGAIELAFNDRDSVVRIGTGDPEKVSEYINGFLKNKITGFQTDKKYRREFLLVPVAIILFLSVPAILLVSGHKENEVKTNKEGFTIKGMYGISVMYRDILEVDTAGVLPHIKSRTNGYDFGGSLRGHFKLNDNSRVRLFVKVKSSPFIHIRTNNTEVYLNFSNRKKTIDLYTQLVQMTKFQPL